MWLLSVIGTDSKCLNELAICPYYSLVEGESERGGDDLNNLSAKIKITKTYAGHIYNRHACQKNTLQML